MIENVGIPMLAFFLGAMPTAYLAGRMVGDVDIRAVGTGNAGALNAYRQLGRRAGLVVMAIDTGKGAVALAIGMLAGVPDVVLYISAVVAALGHNFSPFTGLRGGKGGATVLGMSMLMVWQLTLISIAVGAVVYLFARHSVLALTAIFVALNALTAGLGQPIGVVCTCLALSIVVVVTHVLRTYTNLLPAMRRGEWRQAFEQE